MRPDLASDQDSAVPILLALKSFGDLVIATTALHALFSSGSGRLGLAIGSHLRDLAAALGLRPDHEVRVPDGRVPALFDLRKRGYAAAALSAWSLRRRVAALPPGLLVVDRLGARERLLVAGRAAAALAAGSNIYDDYAALAARLGASPAGDVPPSLPRIAGRRALGLFPGSRMAAKNLPRPLVEHLVARAGDAGWSCTPMLLEGERPDLEDLPGAQVILRGFGNVIAAVRSVDRVVSADSLPAHLAEREGVPVFVYSPVPNTYWLPGSAHRGGCWSLFDQPDDRLAAWLGAAEGTRNA